MGNPRQGWTALAPATAASAPLRGGFLLAGGAYIAFYLCASILIQLRRIKVAVPSGSFSINLVRKLARPDEQVTLLVHQRVDDHPEGPHPTEIIQRRGGLVSEAAGVENASAW